ncbi:MAG: class I tRNA ligase family protein, partial [Gammaproteobacteria bacterium]
NKLWNASRYVMMNVESSNINIREGEMIFSLADRWITTRFARTITQVNEGIHNYRFDLAAQAIYEFTWDEYCDWYLELSKVTLTGEDVAEERKRGTLYTLVNILETLLRLMHPFMPFITEEIWQRTAQILSKQAGTVMLQPYPLASDLKTDNDSLAQMEWVKLFILGVRRIRSERDIPPGKQLAVQRKGGSKAEQQWLDENQDYIRSLARVSEITEVTAAEDDAVMALAGEMTILVPLTDIIDPAEESARLEKELARLNADKQRLEGKLANSSFVDRAPEAVVQKERDKLQEADTAISKLEEQHKRILKLIH